MTTSYDAQVLQHLEAAGLQLPDNPPAPAGKYAPYRLHGGIGFLAAQVPGYGPGSLLGRVGDELTPEHGALAAQSAALNALGRIRQALDGFDRLVGLLHVAGHVASTEDFLDQPAVLDGASILFTSVLGDRGIHSRTAYPHPRLPRNVSIELEITFAYS